MSGEIKPEDLATMDIKDMVVQEKREEINKEIEKIINAARSDWDEKHIKVSSGVYKCKKCGGDKTFQREAQTRSADEPMTVFITCATCKNSWKI